MRQNNQRISGIPIPIAYLSLKSIAPDGRLFQKYHDLSHTWNRNFWNNVLLNLFSPVVASNTFGAGYLNPKCTDGSVVAPSSSTYNILTVVGPAGDSSYGIQAGASSAAESFEGYALGSLIAHGTSAGQLSYQAQNATTMSYNAETKAWSLVMARTFVNNSGSDIIVRETALTVAYKNLTWIEMISRDLPNPAVPVLNGGSLVVTYTINLTFPN